MRPDKYIVNHTDESTEIYPIREVSVWRVLLSVWPLLILAGLAVLLGVYAAIGFLL